MAEITVRIEGLPELLEKFERMKINPQEVDAILYSKGAVPLKRDVLTTLRSKVTRRTGNLEKSVKARAKNYGQFFRTVFVATDHNVAKHSHLIELGTKERRPLHKKVMRNPDTGQWFGKRVAPLKARPYFWPTVEARLPAHGETVVNELQKLLESKMN